MHPMGGRDLEFFSSGNFFLELVSGRHPVGEPGVRVTSGYNFLKERPGKGKCSSQTTTFAVRTAFGLFIVVTLY